MTEQEKDVKQINLIHQIMSSFANDDRDGFWRLVNRLADLREERPLAVAFRIAQSLDDENRKLIKAMC